MFFKRKYTIRINYKSGRSVILKAKSFKVRSSSKVDEIRQIEWEGVRPRPLFMGMDDIESIWAL